MCSAVYVYTNANAYNRTHSRGTHNSGRYVYATLLMDILWLKLSYSGFVLIFRKAALTSASVVRFQTIESQFHCKNLNDVIDCWYFPN